MSYYSVYRNSLKFRDVCRSNIKKRPRRSKGLLETTMCVYACFIIFYVYVLDETYVVGNKLVYKHIWDGIAQVWLYVGLTRCPRVGPQHWSSTLKGSGKTTTQTMASRPGNSPSMGLVDGSKFPAGWGSSEAIHETPTTGRGWDHSPWLWASMVL